MKDNKQLFKPLFTTMLLSTSILLGCGGGSKTETAPVPIPIINQAPAVTIDSENSVEEGQTLTLTANASDADGSISSIKWSTTAANVTLSQDDSATISFMAPNVDSDTVITLTVTVTDNEGATSTENIDITITAKVSNLTIEGVVTDDIISYANVEVMVAEQMFSATADEEGRYSITITIDEENINSLIKIRATGNSEHNPEVEFISQLGSFVRLNTQAGDDNTLTKDENFGVNVTNVTTAEYAILIRNSVFPADNEALDSARLAIDNDEKLILAALIKIVVDGEGDNAFDLPAGVDSTLDLIDDSTSIDAFIDLVTTHNEDLIAATVQSISRDEELVALSAIVGSWVVEGSHDTVINFTKSGFYTHLGISSDSCGFDGFEVGAYSWDANTGMLSLTTTEDTNGCIGLHDEQPLNQEFSNSALSYQVSGNNMVVTEASDNGTQTFNLKRLISDNNPLVGGYFNPTSAGYQILAIFEDNHFLDLGHSVGRFGLNAGTYAWDNTTNLLNYTEVSLNQQDVTYTQTVAVAKGDIVIWKDDEDAGVMVRTRVTSEQPKLTLGDLVGKSYTSVNNSTGWQYDITFNSDFTAQEISSDGITDVNWHLLFGQLVITEPNWVLIASPSEASDDEFKFVIYDFELDANDDGSEAGYYSESSETWTKQ